MNTNCKIVIGINSLTAPQYAAYSNHIQFFFHLGKHFPNVKFMLVNPGRMSIDRMRNLTAEMALIREFDYVLFLDDDVLVPLDSLQDLLDSDADIVAGDVLIRGYPFDHMAYRFDANKTQLKVINSFTDSEKDIVNVDAVGFSYCLIKTSLLKRVPKPYFITTINNTEDIYFCIKARKYVPDCSIKLNRHIDCGHILWNEVINNANRDSYSAYYTTHSTQTQDKPVEVDRGNKYLEEIESIIAKHADYDVKKAT